MWFIISWTFMNIHEYSWSDYWTHCIFQSTFPVHELMMMKIVHESNLMNFDEILKESSHKFSKWLQWTKWILVNIHVFKFLNIHEHSWTNHECSWIIHQHIHQGCTALYPVSLQCPKDCVQQGGKRVICHWWW